MTPDGSQARGGSPLISGPEDLRASDADRDRVAQFLRDAFAEGRLSADEHAERIDRVYAAKTLGDLRPLVSDLPVGQGATRADGESEPPTPTEFGTLAHQTQPVLAILSEAKRTGRWLVPTELVCTAFLGQVHLDLREAVLERGEVTIVANAVLGNVTLVVPEGIVVHDEGMAVLGTRHIRQPSGKLSPGAPVIRLRGTCLLGAVEVKRKKFRW